MRRLLFFIVITAMGMFKGYSQALVQTYVDRCTGQVHVFTVPMNGATAIAFYNKSRTFTAAQFQNGELQTWLEQTYQWWQTLSPCSTNNATSQTTQQTTTQATTNATNAATNATSNATSGATQNTGTTNTGTTNTGTTNTNTNGNTGSTNTGSTGSTGGDGSNSGSTGSSSGSSSSGSTGGDSGGTSSGSGDSSSGDTGSSTDNSSGSDNSGNDSGGDNSGDSGSGGSEDNSGDNSSDNNDNSSSDDNSSGDGDSGDGDSSGESESDSSEEGSESNENSESEESESESSDESSEESTEEESESESEEVEEDEQTEEESDESSEEESEEESDEEESSDEESEEDEEEDSEEESNNEDEEEDDEDDEKKRNLTPPVVTANLVTMQMIDGVLTNAASFGYSQSSLTGETTYAANGMVWSNMKQFSLNLSKSSVLFNWDRREDIMVLDPFTQEYYKFGEVGAKGTIYKVQSISAGYMRMFTTNIFTVGVSDVFLGQKENWMKGFVGGYAITGMGVVLEGGQYVGTAAFTAFGSKPFNFKHWDRLTITPMLAYSMTPASYDSGTNKVNFTKYGNYVIGSNFDFYLTQRFKANIGGTLIGSTMPEMPFSWALTVGSRFQF